MAYYVLPKNLALTGINEAGLKWSYFVENYVLWINHGK